MTRTRLLIGTMALAAVLSTADKDAAGQQGELEVTMRVLDDVTGLAAPRITIPPEASRQETPEPREPSADEAAKSSDTPPPDRASQ